MDAQLRQQAVDDLLEYCRNAQREMNLGRQLAPVLLGYSWSGQRDDYELATTIQDLLTAELAWIIHEG